MTKFHTNFFISYNDLIPRSFPIPSLGKAHMESGRRILAVSSAEEYGEMHANPSTLHKKGPTNLSSRHGVRFDQNKHFTSLTGLFLLADWDMLQPIELT